MENCLKRFKQSQFSCLIRTFSIFFPQEKQKDPYGLFIWPILHKPGPNASIRNGQKPDTKTRKDFGPMSPPGKHATQFNQKSTQVLHYLNLAE